MKKLAAIGLLVVLAVSLVPSAVLAGHNVRIYKGTGNPHEELLFSVAPNGGKFRVYDGPPGGSRDRILLTLKNNRIYQGNVLTNDNVLFTIKEDLIIPGLDSRSSNAVYTVRDGRIYAGRVQTRDNILYTFDGDGGNRGKLYSGSVSIRSNVVFSIRGDIDAIKFLLPILADGLF